MRAHVANTTVTSLTLVDLTGDEAKVLRRYIDETASWDQWAEANAGRFDLAPSTVVDLLEDLYTALEKVD